MRNFFVACGYSVFPVGDTLRLHFDKISDDTIHLVMTFLPFNYKVRDIIGRNFQILKRHWQQIISTFYNKVFCLNSQNIAVSGGKNARNVF